MGVGEVSQASSDIQTVTSALYISVVPAARDVLQSRDEAKEGFMNVMFPRSSHHYIFLLATPHTQCGKLLLRRAYRGNPQDPHIVLR